MTTAAIAVLLYRNQTEQQIDQALYQDGGSAYVFIIFVAMIAFFIGITVAGLIFKKKVGFQDISGSQLIVGAVFAIIITYFLWI
jgi:hypothetical protein